MFEFQVRLNGGRLIPASAANRSDVFAALEAAGFSRSQVASVNCVGKNPVRFSDGDECELELHEEETASVF